MAALGAQQAFSRGGTRVSNAPKTDVRMLADERVKPILTPTFNDLSRRPPRWSISISALYSLCPGNSWTELDDEACSLSAHSRPELLSSSRSCFAAIRSAVSNPSVNRS
jgi:hypothetical protein